MLVYFYIAVRNNVMKHKKQSAVSSMLAHSSRLQRRTYESVRWMIPAEPQFAGTSIDGGGEQLKLSSRVTRTGKSCVRHRIAHLHSTLTVTTTATLYLLNVSSQSRMPDKLSCCSAYPIPQMFTLRYPPQDLPATVSRTKGVDAISIST